jgi:hypothetical protein
MEERSGSWLIVSFTRPLDPLDFVQIVHRECPHEFCLPFLRKFKGRRKENGVAFRLLADENTSHWLVSSCQRLLPGFPICHIASWQEGLWLGLDDACLGRCDPMRLRNRRRRRKSQRKGPMLTISKSANSSPTAGRFCETRSLKNLAL